jgi:hypothetical protein
MIDHTKNAAGRTAQKIPISTAPELLPDWRIAQIAVTVSRTVDVNDATTASTRRPMSDSIGKSSSEALRLQRPMRCQMQTDTATAGEITA